MTAHVENPTVGPKLLVERESLAEKVAKHILTLVRQGDLIPGQKLPSERDLAGSMGVGRPSLREALRALSLMGVLEIRHGEGVFVTELTPDALLQPLEFFLTLDDQSLDILFEARVAIEAGIAEIAASKITGDEIESLRRCMDRGVAALDDPDGFRQVDLEFHRRIVEATKNPFLIRVAQSFQELGKASRQITVQLPGVPKQSHADHATILAALAEGDVAAARQAMVRHLRNVHAAFKLSRRTP